MKDLIERYVYAVTKRLDRKQRQDVTMELCSLIDDMLEERCCGRQPEERDVRIVLTELGAPQALARQYDADKDKCLIGQPYYSTYKYVLKVVLLCILAGLTIAHGILGLLEPVRPFEAVAAWINSLWNCLFGAFSFVTLLFAFFQRRGIRVSESFNFDDLPPVPSRSKEISKWESICGIGFSVVFMVLFVFTPELFCVLYEGKMVSLFELDTVRQTWFIVMAFTVCGIGREVIQLMERQYNKKVLVTALATNGISAALAIWWLTGYDLMNRSFLANLQTIFAGETAIVYKMFANFDRFFLGVLLFALVLDSIDVAVKTLRE